ncbi:winged helix-turn-helix domain-containing protein [Tardiphaga sp. 709]|uniref:winged helix-turn-helix domain-containing protein n=1 Tax=Tardiphaga sp. 709 TaxID=3076039 RepID=UPI0028F01894|nr:winged helix-turn-helix domain-containing protein [Tardiphaga sp. 709]WNV09200.1 winged helix-turn-helix domain-containing protein [Tardiphaga sp. 709]
MYRFAGFEFDRLRAELRGPDGKAIKLRPKTFDMLALFAANAGRIISKQELMEAVWPNVHVGEDSLFQCIRELRTALGDDQRQVIKLVSGRGYMFDVEMLAEPAAVETPAALPLAALSGEPARAVAAAEPVERRRLFGLRGPAALAAMAGLGAIVGLAVAAPIFGPDVIFGRAPPTIAVMPIAGVGSDSQVAETAANVTTRLVDGLAKIDNIRVMTQTAPQPASPLATQPDFVVNGELAKGERSWELRARMTRTATGEVVWTVPVAVSFKDSDLEEPDLGMQRSRLAAGLGHPLALRINALLEPGARTAATVGRSPGNARVAIEQAIASINQTTRERFATAQAMLDKALAEEPNNADLQVALAALQMRGIQMVWYGPDDAAAAEKNAKAMLERAVRTRPSSIPVLEAYCRFLNATNEFVESLVVCARTLAFDPWNGMALYHIGLGQLPLGRFEDALATFKQANRFDTPPVSRWTWLLGAGVSYLMMGRDEEALPWLQRSIAITPASGRPLVLLAAAYQRLGRTDEAQAALTQGLKLRPGSTVSNIGIPTKNVSAAYMEARGRIEQALIAAGLPER